MLNRIAALAAALILASASHAAAMTFEVVSSPTECAARGCVVAEGPIDKQTAAQFESFVRKHKLEAGAVVVLDSPGGNLLQGLALGEAIRKARFVTRVQAYDHTAGRFAQGGRCASACAYVFLGGVERTVAPGARIGVHQVAAPGGDTDGLSAADGLKLMSITASYVERLCGKLDLIIPALRTRPQEIYWLSPVELARYAVITTPAAGA
jgi:hypothetical protein